MNIELIIKAFTLVGIIAGFAKLFYDVSIGRRSRLREEYKFAKDFFDDLASPKGLHPFLREKGYHAVAGENRMSGNEIEYLLSLTQPERALRDYVIGRIYLDHFPRSGNLQISFKKKYQKEFARRWRRYGYFGLYLILAFLALSPLILSNVFPAAPSQTFIRLLVCISFFGPYAFLSLRSGFRIYRAQMLVSHQNKHTATIVVPR